MQAETSADDARQIDADQALHDIDPTLAADIAEATRAPEHTSDESDQPDPLRRVRARVIKMRRADLDSLPSQTASETDTISDATEFDPASFAAKLNFDASAEETSADVALIDDAIEPSEAGDLTELLRKELGTSSLDDDAEDELMRELAEVTAKTGTDSEVAADILSDLDDAAPAQHETPARITDAQLAQDIAADLADDADFRLDDSTDDTAEDDALDDDEARNMFGTSDESVSRLLDTAEREMENGENTRRRNAIQHLKAAVAATRAEQTEPEARDEQEVAQADPYREDLARVVRPRRPTEASTQTPRRLAPLMLVSEQRIDAPQDIPMGANISPVRPRRISSAVLAVQEDEQFATQAEDDGADSLGVTAAQAGEGTDTFADYVETVGAEGLSELLEAAAAYSSFVEGRETVTRPQIMRLASQAMPEEFPLEERLRSFGQLLRQGKIRKIKRGHFVVADGTRFKPEAAAS